MPNIDTKQTIGWVKGALYVLAITGTLIIAIFASNLAKINNIDSAFAQQKATIMIQVQRVDDRGENERLRIESCAAKKEDTDRIIASIDLLSAAQTELTATVALALNGMGINEEKINSAVKALEQYQRTEERWKTGIEKDIDKLEAKKK